ncbi:DUF3325 domain-containing protein [Janthinobacterium psychrotolerans]|uniref:DUF3325 domain-containing protein n=1 Tax=Janthinobacterium psychrotolerans TaxID=1747903 RepID=A0A1A7C9C4_9BURK|nr:DUF3325 domain-containing protein [Janthinobacterium psychrotolerans]OBV41609.1 Protein of unknown function (DUF3325) [Janthinobacterium psychrotolerans]
MLESLLTLAAAAACYLALALLALSQEEHWRRAGMPPATRLAHRWRYVATTMLMLAGVLCMAGHGAGFGLILWVMLVGAAIVAVALTLSWRPQWLGGMARVTSRIAP